MKMAKGSFGVESYVLALVVCTLTGIVMLVMAVTCETPVTHLNLH